MYIYTHMIFYLNIFNINITAIHFTTTMLYFEESSFPIFVR